MNHAVLEMTIAAPHAPARRAGADLTARVERVVAIAAAAADAVDREARFPTEAFAALRAERLLGVTLPAELGGEAASLADIVDLSYRLGQACGSTGMIYAMHQACVACVLRHGQQEPWHRALLRRLADEQLLCASSTTEGMAGGNVRSSAAPIEREADGIRLHRAASVVSYGAEADVIVTTARRAADAAPSDQVLAVFRREDYTLTLSQSWDTLGMRGTCSTGFDLRAAGVSAQVLPEPYERIHPQSMVPVSHLAWSGVWAGIAADAVERARAFVRRTARENNGAMPPGAAHLAKATAGLHTLRGIIAMAMRAYEQAADDGTALMAREFQTMITLTKVQASETAVAVVMEAVRTCGLAGYRNDSPFSVGRHLRDVLSSPLMISNDRILANLASTTLLTAVPASLWV